MPAKRPQFATMLQVPDLQCPVVGTCDEVFAVQRQGEGPDPMTVGMNDTARFPGLKIPHSHATVVRRGYDPAAVGCYCKSTPSIGVPAEHSSLGTSREIEYPHSGVASSRDDKMPIGADSDGPVAVIMHNINLSSFFDVPNLHCMI